jgi:F-type H+-transporting ATPase subunit delta
MTAAPTHPTTHDNIELFRLVDRVYALTLIELAEQANQVREVSEEIAQLRQLTRDNPGFIKLLASRVLPMESRVASLEKVFKGKVSDLTFRFLKLLVKKSRFDEIDGVAGAYAKLMDERHGVLEVEAYTAQPLEPATRQRITDHIHQITKREVKLHEHVQPELIGGLRLRVGDAVIDGSTLTQLRKMKEQLVASGRERVRTALDAHLRE